MRSRSAVEARSACRQPSPPQPADARKWLAHKALFSAVHENFSQRRARPVIEAVHAGMTQAAPEHIATRFQRRKTPELCMILPASTFEEGTGNAGCRARADIHVPGEFGKLGRSQTDDSGAVTINSSLAPDGLAALANPRPAENRKPRDRSRGFCVMSISRPSSGNGCHTDSAGRCSGPAGRRAALRPVRRHSPARNP